MVAAVCFAVLATHVDLGFERIRFRVVAAPITASEPSLQLTLPDLSRLHGAPVAVIARLRAGDEPARLRLTLDTTTLAEVAVAPRGRMRLDRPTRVSGRGHVIEVAGDGTGWQLEYLEIANLHGFSEGALSFVVVPRDRGADSAPWWVALIVALELLLLGLSSGRPTGRLWRSLWSPVAVLALLLFGITLGADLVTPYRILLSPVTFILGVAVLYAGQLLRGLRQAAALAPPFRTLLAFTPHVALAVIVMSGVTRLYDPATGFTRLIMFGSAFAPSAVPALHDAPLAIDSEYGYDGQFYAQLALDPLLRDPATVRALDSPTYRARRVLVPGLAYLIGLGKAWPVLQAYALINVASWLVLGWLILRWLPAGHLASTLGWIGVMASHGLLVSIRLALSDGPSALIIALAIAALQAERRWLSAALVGLSGLAKETSLLAGAILLPSSRPFKRRAIEVAGQSALALAPFALWIGYLTLLALPGATTGERNFGLPLSAYGAKWLTSLHELRPGDPDTWTSALTLIALTTQALYLAATREWRHPWWRVGAGYAVLMLVVGPAVWDGIPGAITRVVLPMTLAFNILVPRHRWFLPLWVLGNANLAHGPPELGLSWHWW